MAAPVVKQRNGGGLVYAPNHTILTNQQTEAGETIVVFINHYPGSRPVSSYTAGWTLVGSFGGMSGLAVLKYTASASGPVSLSVTFSSYVSGSWGVVTATGVTSIVAAAQTDNAYRSTATPPPVTLPDATGSRLIVTAREYSTSSGVMTYPAQFELGRKLPGDASMWVAEREVYGPTTPGNFQLSATTYLNGGTIGLIGTAGGDTVAPTITSSSTASVAANEKLSLILTANETATWSVEGGNAAYFEISGSTLRWALDGFAPAQGSFPVIVRATDTAGNSSSATVTVTVTQALGEGLNTAVRFDAWQTAAYTGQPYLLSQVSLGPERPGRKILVGISTFFGNKTYAPGITLSVKVSGVDGVKLDDSYYQSTYNELCYTEMWLVDLPTGTRGDVQVTLTSGNVGVGISVHSLYNLGTPPTVLKSNLINPSVTLNLAETSHVVGLALGSTRRVPSVAEGLLDTGSRTVSFVSDYYQGVLWTGLTPIGDTNYSLQGGTSNPGSPLLVLAWPKVVDGGAPVDPPEPPPTSTATRKTSWL